MTGVFALDLFQAAGYNQDTILVTSYITLQLTTGSNTSGQEQGQGIINAAPVLHDAGHIKQRTISQEGKTDTVFKLFTRSKY